MGSGTEKGLANSELPMLAPLSRKRAEEAPYPLNPAVIKNMVWRAVGLQTFKQNIGALFGFNKSFSYGGTNTNCRYSTAPYSHKTSNWVIINAG